jgi:hypothetical protein
MKCNNCDNDGIFRHQLILCDHCYYYDNFALISLEDSKKNYSLNDKDLIGINYTLKSNTSNKNKKYYILDEIENIAVNKFGGRIKALDYLKDRDEKKKELIERKKTEKNLRKNKLIELFKLKKINLNYLNTEICANYIKKGEKIGKDIGYIVNYFEELNFYEHKTNYKKIYFDYKKNNGFVDLEEIKNLSIEKFVKDNYENFKDLFLIVPDNLKYKIEKYMNQNIKIHEF